VIFTHLRRHRLRTTYLSTVQQTIANGVACAKKTRWVDLASGNFYRPSLRMALPIVLRSNFSKFWKILSEEGGSSRDIRLNKSPGLSRKLLHRRIQYQGGPHGELCQDRWRKPPNFRKNHQILQKVIKPKEIASVELDNGVPRPGEPESGLRWES